MTDFTAAVPEIDVGTELNTSEYLVFLLSADTYLRYLREHGIEPAPDSPEGAHMIAGVQLLRAFDRVFLEPVTEHLKSLLPTEGQKKMVEKGARQILNRDGLSLRAFLFRTALERGGASTVSAIFKTNKYKAAVRSALSASVNEDADAALDVFKEIPLTHAKVRGWIDDAARLAVSEPRPQNPVAAAANVTSDKVPPLVASQVGADANNASSEKNLGQKALVADTLTDIQQSATEEAKKAIQKSGQEDSMVTKSEAMGIAAAMVAAQASNSDSSLPPAIRRLQDAEQRDVAMASGRVVVQATAGAGKCVVGSTLVRTSEGWIPIQDFAEDLSYESTSPLKILVQGKDGPEYTSAIYRDGFRPTIKVTTRYGYSIEGTGKHPILVLRNGQVDWVKLSDLEEGDFVCIDRRPALFSESPYRIEAVNHPDTRRKPCELPLELNHDLASLLGYIVSEGSFSFEYGVQLSTNDAEQQFLYTNCLKACSVPFSLTVDKRNGVLNTTIASKNYLEGFIRYGLSPALAHEKCVPEGIFRSPKPVVRSFLRALFDGDGSATDLQVSYASASHLLAKQVHELLLGFGVIGRLRFKPNTKKGCWQIDITGDAARLFFKEIGFNLRRKQDKAHVFESRTSNTNVGVVPGIRDLFWSVREEVRGKMSFTTVERYGAFNSVMGGVREPSRQTIRNFVEASGSTSDIAKVLLNLADTPWFFDPVVSLDHGEAEVYDFVVPETHSFSAGGFVNHNTTTLVSMLQYLVEDKKVPPERVFVGVFNVKAADTIVGRAKRLMGDETVKKMTLGTMHSRFLQAILKYGTADQREAFTRRLVSDRSKKTPNPFITPAQLNGTMVAVWKECFPNKPLPKGVNTAMEKWKFNNLTPDQALAQALDPNEESLAIWYQWQMGFKGLLGTNWAPPCVGTQVPRFDNRGLPITDNKAASKWWGFLARYRTDTSGNGGIGSKTLADHTDMILQFRDLLRDNPSARKAIQDQFDYILFDEAQDLSAVAHQIADLMSEKIDVESKDKALMFIGDVTQAVNAFVGGSPKHMAKRYEDGFTLKTIRTNHRCLPEIVEASQRLLSNHPKSIPFEAQADPAKPRGEASIRVMTVRDQSVAAQNLLSEWQSKVSIGGDWSDFAVLSRTRRELDTYELGCIVNGVPYSRKGGGSFLQSSEMLTVMGYMNVVTSSDYVAVRKSLGKVLNTPNRFFLTGDKKPEEMVEQAANALARSRGVGLDQLDPMELFNSHDGVDELLNVIFPNGEKMRLERGPMAWKLDKAREQIENLGQTIGYLRTKVQKEGKPDDKGDIKYPTSRLLDDILMIEGVPEGPKGNQKAVTVKDVLIPPMRALEDESAATEVMDPEEAALGTVFFLKVIAEGAAGAVKQGFNPVAPDDFMGYMKKLYTEAKDLRVDVNEWDEEQAALYPDEPEKRKKAPAVTLSTIHCSPPDEPVLTTEGWVPISQLDPEKHRLASYIQKCNQAVWGKNTPGGNREGYPFLLASQAYEGKILTLRTERSKTRVTPNHKVLVRFSPNFNDKYIVYLMRRGNWWRIGLCVSARRPYKAAGVACRLATEQADAGWILGVYNTREEALVAESCFQGKYGILGLTFQSSKGRSLTTNQLHEIHDSVKAESTDRAKRLLLDAGLDILDPLYRRNATDSDMERINMRGGFLTSSCNVLSGYMEVSVPTQAFVTKEGSSEEIMKPEWLPVSVSSENYNGDVYSMVVMPHRTYVSGGMIVGNSVKGAEWNSVAVVMTHGTFPMAPRKIPGEEKLSPEKQAILAQRREDDFLTERQLAYVGMTRAGSNLTVISQNRDSKGRVIPPSSFIIEAGLVDGENVNGQPAPLPPAAPIKTASIYVEGDLWQT